MSHTYLIFLPALPKPLLFCQSNIVTARRGTIEAVNIDKHR